ncbi:MAG: hypothetical protein ACK50J_24760 [Planctomyces sp.]
MPIRENGHTTIRSLRATQFLAVSLLILTLIAGLLYPFPLRGRLWGEIFNLGHTPVFFLTFITISALLSRRFASPPEIAPGDTRGEKQKDWKLQVAIFLVLALGGSIAELLQGRWGRHASVSDLMANCLGLFGGFLWRVGRHASLRVKSILRLGTTAILLAGITQPVIEIADCVQQIREFPLLSSLESSAEIRRWKPVSSRISITSEWWTHGRKSLKIELRPTRFSGVILETSSSDWDSEDYLCFDAMNRSGSDLILTVKVYDHDHQNSSFSPDDRFEKAITLTAGAATSVQIPVDEIAEGPAGRRMNMKQITALEVFCTDVSERQELLIDHVRLASSPE